MSIGQVDRIEVVVGTIGQLYQASSIEIDLVARSAANAMTISYSTLLERVGHHLYGIWESYSADQTLDIVMCISDGLKRVYAAHEWSFFHPVKYIMNFLLSIGRRDFHIQKW